MISNDRSRYQFKCRRFTYGLPYLLLCRGAKKMTHWPDLFLPIKGKGKGIRFIVLYPSKCSHYLPPLAGGNHLNPPRDIPEQLAAYSAQALSTALLMLGTHFAVGYTEAIWNKLSCPRTDQTCAPAGN